MKFWKQLRWRIIGGHMLVVLVGVLMLTLAGEFFILRTTPKDLLPYITNLVQAETPAEIDAGIAQLLEEVYRSAITRALLVAAISAILAGLLTSLFLAREILRPLLQIAAGSERIAQGRYSERVAVPAATELSVVATNFNQMAEALEHVEQTRVALISNVMHELRTPLTGLEGYLEGLMDGVFSNNPETFAQMSHEVRRMKRLVNDLQALSQVEAGQISLHWQSFDVIPTIQHVIDQLRPQADAQCLEIVTPQPDTPLMVHADADRTTQIIVNLVGNAIRYTPKYGCIQVSVSAADGIATIKVIDNGLGIPPEALSYIFERFYRVDRSRARNSGGSGIGLTISRHMAWAMGGELTADSPGLGQGSTFTFTLPCIKKQDYWSAD